MAKMDEMVRAADELERKLLGSGGTHDDIENALQTACRGWPEEDWTDVVILTAHAMNVRADELWLSAGASDNEVDLGAALHLLDLCLDLNRFLDRAPPLTQEQRADRAVRHLRYPLPATYWQQSIPRVAERLARATR